MKTYFVFPNYFDESNIKETKTWVTNLLKENQYNLKYLFTWYSLDTYQYTYNPKDTQEMPNIHTFTFKPKCKTPRYQLGPKIQNSNQILDLIIQELNQKPFLDNAIEESFQYTISQDLKTIIITFKASE